jgi:hypothetical protein
VPKRHFLSASLALANMLYKQEIGPHSQTINLNSQTSEIGKIIREDDNADNCSVLLRHLVTE